MRQLCYRGVTAPNFVPRRWTQAGNKAVEVARTEQIAGILPDAKILVVSALSDKATALRAVTKGAHGFLQKPFTDESMVLSLLELMS